jgi:hypothetical protein
LATSSLIPFSLSAIASTSFFVPLKISLPSFTSAYTSFSKRVMVPPAPEPKEGLLGTSLISTPNF